MNQIYYIDDIEPKLEDVRMEIDQDATADSMDCLNDSPTKQVRQIREFAGSCGSWSYVVSFDSLTDLAQAAHMFINEGKVWNDSEWIPERRQRKR